MRFFTAKKLLFGGGLGAVTTYGYYNYKNRLEKRKAFTTPEINKIQQRANKVIHNFKSRNEHIQDIQNTSYDVLVVGGGCNGAGVALEAASRGLKCLLIEANDFASGASSKSTKLIHGGVRYLEQAFQLNEKNRIEKFNLVVEALKERSYMIENAQYMNKKLPTVVPATNIFEAIYYYIGCVVYHSIYYFYQDRKNNHVTFDFPYILWAQEMRNMFPHLSSKLKYGIVYYDGQMNDSRMNMDLLLTSTIPNYKNNFINANIVNYMSFIDFIKDDNGRIIGAKIYDKMNNCEMNVKTNCVINCTGAFADKIRQLDNPNVKPRIIPCSGTHLVMPNKFCNKKMGLILPKTDDGRVMFLIPWMSHTLVGTTDNEVKTPEIDPNVPFDDIIFIIKEMSKFYPDYDTVDLTRQVQSKWCGLRPLVKEEQPEEIQEKQKSPGAKVSTKAVSRRHVVERTNSGLISLMGGKWTIYRAMGEETVDAILEYFKANNIKTNYEVTPSQTKTLRLVGDFNAALNEYFIKRKEFIKFYSNLLSDQYDMPIDISKYLIKNYGDRAFDIGALYFNTKENKERLHNNHPITIGEVRYNIKNEMGVTPIDVIFRRTRLGFLDSQAIYDVYPKLIQIFAEENNWTDEERQVKQKEYFETIRKMDF